jgi:hypothetical protein
MKKFKIHQRPRRKYIFYIVGHKKALKIWWDSPFDHDFHSSIFPRDEVEDKVQSYGCFFENNISAQVLSESWLYFIFIRVLPSIMRNIRFSWIFLRYIGIYSIFK